jgi:hypothetical protein
LRAPWPLVVFFCLPAVGFWCLTIWIATAGGGRNVGLVPSLVTSAIPMMLAWTGTTADATGVHTREPLGRRRRVAWEDVADVHRHGRMVYLRTVSGELVPVLGMPSRRYRRERYRGPGRLTDHVIADLRSRIPAGRHGG